MRRYFSKVWGGSAATLKISESTSTISGGMAAICRSLEMKKVKSIILLHFAIDMKTQ